MQMLLWLPLVDDKLSIVTNGVQSWKKHVEPDSITRRQACLTVLTVTSLNKLANRVNGLDAELSG
jgi:hypothetical protein